MKLRCNVAVLPSQGDISELVEAVEGLAEITGESPDKVIADLCEVIERQVAFRKMKSVFDHR
jgi:hypothetical protein